jgi:hypothetical protein
LQSSTTNLLQEEDIRIGKMYAIEGSKLIRQAVSTNIDKEFKNVL